MTKLSLDLYECCYKRNDPSVIAIIKARQKSLDGLKPVSLSYLAQDNPWLYDKLPDYILSRPYTVEDVYERNLKVRQKQWGPMGQVPSRTVLAEMLDRYYQEVPSMEELNRDALMLYDYYVLRNIPKHLDWTLPDRAAYAYLSRPKGKSNSGYCGFSDSRDSRLIIQAMKGASEINKLFERGKWSPTLDPAIAWYRYQHKPRTIFGTSLTTMVSFARFGLTPFTTILHDYVPAVAYCPPDTTARRITDFCRKYPLVIGLEGDYEAMDTTVSASKVKRILTHVAEFTLAEHAEATLAYAESIFHEPLIDFDAVVTLGEHALFSGEGPTNGCENYLNLYHQALMMYEIIRYLALITATDLTLANYERYVSFQPNAVGDDSALLIGFTRELLNLMTPDMIAEFEAWLPQKFADTATRLGFRAERSKQRVSRNGVWFCQRYYPLRQMKGIKLTSDGYPIPVYPVLRSIRGGFNPEHGPSRYAVGMTPQCWDIVRMSQTFDNAIGDQYYLYAVNSVRSCITREQVMMIQNNMPVIADKASKLFCPWRAKVYDDAEWDPMTSSTLQLLLS